VKCDRTATSAILSPFQIEKNTRTEAIIVWPADAGIRTPNGTHDDFDVPSMRHNGTYMAHPQLRLASRHAISILEPDLNLNRMEVRGP
jgi:hypothetical protein